MKNIAYLPVDDAQRTLLHNEVHARPQARIRLPALVVYVAVVNDGVSREQECAHLQTLPGQQALVVEQLQTNFYSLINQYRVQEVVERMQFEDAEKYTLIGIAYDCGFQSKATFNRIFKQKMGCSPSKYKKQLEFKSRTAL